MNGEWTTEQWEDAIRAVFRRALQDRQFRQLALKDPTAAFGAANGQPPPDGVRFRFAESLEEHVYVLPKLAVAQDSISEIDLSRILHHAFRQQSMPPAFPAVAGTPSPPC